MCSSRPLRHLTCLHSFAVKFLLRHAASRSVAPNRKPVGISPIAPEACLAGNAGRYAPRDTRGAYSRVSPKPREGDAQQLANHKVSTWRAGSLRVLCAVGWISSCAIHRCFGPRRRLGAEVVGWRKSLSTLQLKRQLLDVAKGDRPAPAAQPPPARARRVVRPYVMHILFVTSNRLGDAILSTGLLDHLIRTYPDCRITVVCGPVAAELFARMPNCERVIVLDKRRWSLHWPLLWAVAARRRWDKVVDIRGSGLAWMVRARRRAVMRPRPGHKLSQLAAVLGIDPPPLPVAWFSAEDVARAAAFLPAGTPTGRPAGRPAPPHVSLPTGWPAATPAGPQTGPPLVALGPTANWTQKVWPADRFVALFRALAAGPLPGAVPLVLAGPGAAERAMAAPVLAALPEAIDLVGRLSLPEVAACLARAALFVGHDSGLMHLAAAAGAPTLGLFGPTPADEYAPAGRHSAVVIAMGRDMADLPVERAVAAAERLITRVTTIRPTPSGRETSMPDAPGPDAPVPDAPMPGTLRPASSPRPDRHPTSSPAHTSPAPPA
jgi:heptosyltransferase III